MSLITIIALTLTPFLELRASIPYGLLGTHLSPLVVITTAIITNIILGMALYLLVGTIMKLLLHYDWMRRLWNKMIIGPRRKVERYVDKYGTLGIALFIGIPLPGSGVYTAAIGSYLLGISKKHFFIATLIGVVIAALLVSIIVISGNEVFAWIATRP